MYSQSYYGHKLLFIVPNKRQSTSKELMVECQIARSLQIFLATFSDSSWKPFCSAGEWSKGFRLFVVQTLAVGYLGSNIRKEMQTEFSAKGCACVHVSPSALWLPIWATTQGARPECVQWGRDAHTHREMTRAAERKLEDTGCGAERHGGWLWWHVKWGREWKTPAHPPAASWVH